MGVTWGVIMSHSVMERKKELLRACQHGKGCLPILLACYPLACAMSTSLSLIQNAIGMLPPEINLYKPSDRKEI